MRLVVVVAMFLAGTAAGASGDLGRELGELRAGLAAGEDSTRVSEGFLRALERDGVSAGDLETYLRERLTPAEYARFHSRLETSLRGIAPVSLTGAELASLAVDALAGAEPQGLSWSPCATDLLEGS